MDSSTTRLYHVHDPMCSWCWGFRPTWQAVRGALPDHIEVVNVLGGLAPDTDEPMPEALRPVIQGHWTKIQQTLGTEFNFDFWRDCEPRRDTYKACRAVVVATAQGREEAMIEAIQRGYYLRAMNPSDPEVLEQLAVEIGLDGPAFRAALVSEDTEREFRRQLMLARRLGVRSFPSLVLAKEGRPRHVPIDYHDPQTTLEAITAA